MQKMKIATMFKEIMFLMTLLTIECSASNGERCEYNMMDMEIKKEHCSPKKVDVGYCNGFCTSTSSIGTSFPNITRGCTPVADKIEHKVVKLICRKKGKVFEEHVNYQSIKECRCQNLE